MLAADAQRAQGLCQLGDRGHLPVERAAAAALGAQAAHGDMLPAVHLEAQLNQGLGGAVAHGLGVGALAAGELESAEQGGLAGAGLSREDGEAAGELHAGLLDEGNPLDVELV